MGFTLSDRVIKQFFEHDFEKRCTGIMLGFLSQNTAQFRKFPIKEKAIFPAKIMDHIRLIICFGGVSNIIYLCGKS